MIEGKYDRLIRMNKNLAQWFMQQAGRNDRTAKHTIDARIYGSLKEDAGTYRRFAEMIDREIKALEDSE